MTTHCCIQRSISETSGSQNHFLWLLSSIWHWWPLLSWNIFLTWLLGHPTVLFFFLLHWLCLFSIFYIHLVLRTSRASSHSYLNSSSRMTLNSMWMSNLIFTLTLSFEPQTHILSSLLVFSTWISTEHLTFNRSHAKLLIFFLSNLIFHLFSLSHWCQLNFSTYSGQTSWLCPWLSSLTPHLQSITEILLLF